VPLLLSVQMQYRLPPGSHPAVAVPLPLSVQMQYRCSTGYLPQQQRTGGNRYCASLSAQTERERESSRPLLDG
jgi:hypothetical protein